MWDVGIWRTIQTIHIYPYLSISIHMFILFALGARPRPRLPVFGFSVTVIQPLRQPLAKPSDFPTEIDGSQWISMVGVIHSWGPLLEPSINWGLGCVVLTDRFSCFRLCHLRPHGVLPGAPLVFGDLRFGSRYPWTDSHPLLEFPIIK